MSESMHHSVGPARVALRVLGDFQVLSAGQPVTLPQSRKTRALLAFLACTGKPQRRERLCELFWEIPDDPRGALRWSLSKIRQIVGPALEADRNTVQLVPGSFDLDLADLREACSNPLETSPSERLEAVALHFRGSFLADMYLPRCPEFEAWRTAIADECELSRIRLLRHLVARLGDEPQKALACAHALQDILPDDDGLPVEIARLRQAARQSAATAMVQAIPENRPEPAAPAPAPSGDFEQVAAPDIPAAAKMRASVLAIDLISPVQIFELVDPEAAAEQFEPLYADIDDVAQRYGGTILELGNGQALIGFGVSPASEDHALLACRAGLQLVHQIKIRTGGGVRMRAAIDTGDVILQPRGSTVGLTGAAPRQARRLAHALKRDAIALTGRARVAAGGYVRSERFDHNDLSGVGRDEECWELKRENRALSRWHLRLHRASMPLLAREAELFALHAAWRRTRSGVGQVVAVSSEAGLGKSRLVHEFCDSVATEGAYLIESGGLEPDRTHEFGLVRAIMGNLCGLQPDDGSEAAGARLAAMASELSLEPWHLPALSFLLRTAEGDGPWSKFETEDKVQRIGEAIRAFASACARRSPRILLVEDLHWADPQSEAVIAKLVDAAAAAPILLIVTHRPDYVAPWQSRTHCQMVKINRFTPSECEEAVAAALGTDASTEVLRSAIVRQCDGSPLFIEEAVRSLAEEGRIAGEPGSFHAVGVVERVQIPSTVRALVTARIARLEPRQRRLLQVAALGPAVSGEPLLRQVAQIGESEFSAAVEGLLAGEFLVEVSSYPTMSYAVASPLMREVAAGMLVAADRAAIEDRFGAAAGDIGIDGALQPYFAKAS
jgi:hypothetical protein